MIDKPKVVKCGKGWRNITMMQRMGPIYGGAKLTDTQVEEIKNRYASGLFTQQQLADEYHIDRSNISHIINGRSWKAIGNPVKSKRIWPGVYGRPASGKRP